MATVIKQDSPWAQLLGGIGEGLAQGTKVGMAQKQQEIDLEKEILAGTAAGKYDPLIWASKSGQEFLKKAKIHGRPAIRDLVRAGLDLLPRDDGVRVTQGGSVTNVPQADLSVLGSEYAPSDREVHNLIEADEARKKLEMAKKESDLIYGRSVGLEAIRAARMSGISDPVQLVSYTRQAMEDAGMNLDDYSVTANTRGQVSINFNTGGSKLSPGKVIEIGEEFDRQVNSAYNKRTQNIRSLSGILAGDVSLASVDVDPSDAVAVALKAAAEAVGATKGGAKKIMERASRAKAIVKTLNEEIDVINRSIENAGRRAGKDSKTIEASKIRHVEFEDISGGVSEAEWLKSRAKEEQPADKVIGDIRETPLNGRGAAGRFSESGAKSDADKLKRVYDGVKDVVMAAVAANPSLTSETIKSNILSMKREIMAEYGLNERLWSMLMQMSNRTMA